MSGARLRRREASSRIELFGLRSLPEITPGDDLAALIADAPRREELELRTGDILVLAQKVVSKAEGRVVRLRDVKPSELARSWARTIRADPRFVEMVLRESRRVIRMTERALIVETRHGFICANAGVDRSNVRSAGSVTCLPLDPDRSAQRLVERLRKLTGRAGRCHRLGHFRAAVATGSYERGDWRRGAGRAGRFARHSRCERARVARDDSRSRG